MSLDSGRRNKRILIEREIETGRDTLNQPIIEWALYAKPSADVIFGSGSEQRAAAQTDATQAATFEILANSKTRALLMTDRVRFLGGLWDIRGIAPIGDAGIKINAVRQVP